MKLTNKQVAGIPRTPWFPGDVKPARVGVYQTRIRRGNRYHDVFQCWDGKVWGAYDTSAARAACLSGFRSIYQNLQWRGLARDPYAEGQHRKERGIKRALAHAGDGWKHEALNKAREWSAKPENRVGTFAFEDVRAWMLENGLEPPPHHNAWGALAQAAQKAGIIVPTGKFRAAVSPATHRHPVRLYKVAA